MPPTPPDDGPLLITAKQAAAELAVSRDYIYRLCASGEIESYLLRGSGSRARRIVRASLLDWVRNQPANNRPVA